MAATGIPINISSRRRSYTTAMSFGCKISPGVFPAVGSPCRFLHIRASKSGSDQLDEPDSIFQVKQDDVRYLVKIGAGSFLGAAAIKYGSALFPEITTPNILQALLMILSPVILAVLLLIKKTSADGVTLYSWLLAVSK